MDEFKSELWKYLRMRVMWFQIVTVFDLVFLLALWELGHRTGFFIYLSLSIVSLLGFASWVRKAEKELGVNL